MSNLIILEIENVIGVFLLLSYSYLFKNTTTKTNKNTGRYYY